MEETIPIFIITFERVEALKKALNSFTTFFDDKVHFVIHDNGSTYPPMVSFLKRLEQRKRATVFRRRRIKNPRYLNRVNKTVVNHFKKLGRSSNYIVTDCDIYFDKADKDLFAYYSWLLKKFSVDVVGPMIEIRDIPDFYPLKRKVIKRHKNRFWGKDKRKSVVYKGEKRQIIFAPIDTTFAMHSAGSIFKRLKRGIRTFEPYICKHWDWYLHPEKIPLGQQYYTKNAAKSIAHWNIQE